MAVSNPPFPLLSLYPPDSPDPPSNHFQSHGHLAGSTTLLALSARL